MVPIHKAPRTRKVSTGDQEFEKLLRRAAKHLATRKQKQSRGVTKKKRRKPARRTVKR